MRKLIFLNIFILLFCAAATAETIKLPTPKSYGTMSFEESVYRRRSVRDFLKNPLTKEQIAQLLWACQGITDGTWNFRSAPSAGSIYPLEIYLVNEIGVYHYNPLENTLEQTTPGNKKPQLARAALAQNCIDEAPIDILVTAVYRRTREKFGMRSERYVHMEAGHAAENLVLQATALGLGAVTIGSFWDDVVSSALKLPPEHEPLYIIPIGYEKK